MTQYRITDWAEHFETAEARKTKMLRWVALPLKHDGLTYRRLMRQDPMFYLAWVLILGCAAKARTRGVLADENGPYDTEALSIKTDCPRAVFDKAIPALLSCGWLTAEEVTTASGQHPDDIRTASGRHPDDSGDHPATVHTVHTFPAQTAAQVSTDPTGATKKRTGTPNGGTTWAAWCDLHTELGLPSPEPLGPDTSAAKQLAKVAGIQDILRAYLADETPFLVTAGHPLRDLPRRINGYKSAEKLIAGKVDFSAEEMAYVFRQDGDGRSADVRADRDATVSVGCDVAAGGRSHSSDLLQSMLGDTKATG